MDPLGSTWFAIRAFGFWIQDYVSALGTPLGFCVLVNEVVGPDLKVPMCHRFLILLRSLPNSLLRTQASVTAYTGVDIS